MTDKFACVPTTTTAGAALTYLRQNADTLETINEVYALDGDRHLRGVASIRQILTADPRLPIRDFMTLEPASVPPRDRPAGSGPADRPLRPPDPAGHGRRGPDAGHRHD